MLTIHCPSSDDAFFSSLAVVVAAFEMKNSVSNFVFFWREKKIYGYSWCDKRQVLLWTEPNIHNSCSWCVIWISCQLSSRRFALVFYLHRIFALSSFYKSNFLFACSAEERKNTHRRRFVLGNVCCKRFESIYSYLLAIFVCTALQCRWCFYFSFPNFWKQTDKSTSIESIQCCVW